MTTKQQIKINQLLAQQVVGKNTVKDSIDLLKLMNIQKQEAYIDDHDIEALALSNSAMLAVVVDVLGKLSKNE